MAAKGRVGDWVARTGLRVANRFNPLVSSPSAPLRTAAFLEAFGPSLMPRESGHQGVAAGLSVLAADLVGTTLDRGVRSVVPPTAPYSVRAGSRLAVAVSGHYVSRLPETDDESTAKASLRTAGRLATSAAIGGIIYETGIELRTRYPAAGPLRPIALSASTLGAAFFFSGRLLKRRRGLIERWSDEDQPASLPRATAIGFGVATTGRLLGRGFLTSRRAVSAFFGDDPVRAQIGRSANTVIWGAGAVAAYNLVVGRIGRANETVERAFAHPPTNPYVSGGPRSSSPFFELGREGRRYVTDSLSADLIDETLGETGALTPIRAFVGYNSEPLYPSGRSEMMMEELERLGAFERKYLLLVSPTGTGWVDQTVVECAEFFARGDIASCCIQYGRTPSFLAVHKVALGRFQFRHLLWGVKQRLAGMPPDERPTVLVFGESLGAWSSSDVVMHQGIRGFDHYGIDRALWFGLPGLAKWSKTGMREGSSELVPPGTVGAFDRYDQLAALSPAERDRLRAIVLDHDNDPIAQVSLRLAVKQPPWLGTDDRGRGVPPTMAWAPLLTFVHVAVDAMNAMRVVPGEFKSFGHDYRADTARMVHEAFRLPPVTEEQQAEVHRTLLRLEVERGKRIERSAAEAAAAPTERRTEGPQWQRSLGTDSGPSS